MPHIVDGATRSEDKRFVGRYRRLAKWFISSVSFKWISTVATYLGMEVVKEKGIFTVSDASSARNQRDSQFGKLRLSKEPYSHWERA